MPLTFYPHSDDAEKGSLDERVETLKTAAEEYKAVVEDVSQSPKEEEKLRGTIPRDLTIAYNWEEIARILREIRELPEIDKHDKDYKADMLMKLSEIYEVLRSAKMPKLEAVRLALMSEAKQLNGTSQTA